MKVLEVDGGEGGRKTSGDLGQILVVPERTLPVQRWSNEDLKNKYHRNRKQLTLGIAPSLEIAGSKPTNNLSPRSAPNNSVMVSTLFFPLAIPHLSTLASMDTGNLLRDYL